MGIKKNRKGKAIMTSTGIMFYPLDPRPEDVEIEDIAHHLSGINRYNGASSIPYSVAIHTIIGTDLCMAYWPKDYDTALRFMLHDAAESYSQDMTRPIKESIPELKAIEKVIELTIADKFGIPNGIMTNKVREIDDNLLKTEFTFLMPWVPVEMVGKHLTEIGPAIFRNASYSATTIKQMYLQKFDYLYDKSNFNHTGKSKKTMSQKLYVEMEGRIPRG